MDQSLPFISRKVVRFTDPEQVCVQEEVETGDRNSSDCVIVNSGPDEKAGLLEMEPRSPVNNSLSESDLEASGDGNLENTIMDKLFQACDPRGKGKVRVSDLVEYLTTILDMQLHDSGAVGSLISLMDPNHINSEIDSETFHHGFHKWIQQMKSGSLDKSLQSVGEDSFQFDVSQNTEYTGSSGEESSLEERLCISQLYSSLTDLQHINRKLSEEIKESRTIIDVKEEELSKLTKDLHMTQSQVRRLQEFADLRHEAELENEELREEVTNLTKQLETEKLKKHQMEQEKELLKAQLQRYKGQVSKLTAELDVSQHLQEDFKAQLAINKEKISQLKLAFCGLEAQLAEKDEHIEELQAYIREITQVNEDLKKQNREIQEQLNEAQQNLHCFKSAMTNPSSHDHLSTLREMASEIEDDMEQLKTINTHQFPSSIHNELQFLLNDSPNLPWPLSQKELKESVVTTPDLVSQVGNAGIMSRQSTSEEPKSSDSETHDSEDMKDSPQKSCKCSCDYHYDVSHEKLRMFVSLLKYFKDENRKLRHIVTKCCLSKRAVTACDGNGNEPTSDGRGELHSTKEKTVDSEGIEQAVSRDATSKLRTCNEKLLLEITRLKRSHVKLAEDLHKSEIHISELDEALQKTQLTLNIERQKSADLEESLYSSTLARQLDLKDIWRLVQKDVETEYEEFQEDSLNTNVTDQLKEKISREIETLRINFERKESFLGSLKNNNLDLHFTRNNDDMSRTCRWNYGRNMSPTSPLVDALTIDALNGNFPMQHINYPYQPAFVSCEDVDCYECRAARLFLQSRFATSCPSMVLSAASQGFEGNTKDNIQPFKAQDTYSEVINSSTEVAANVDVLLTNTPKRKRSLYGSYRRQDFIRSSGRCPASRTPDCRFSRPLPGYVACVPKDNNNILHNNSNTSNPSFTCNNVLPSNNNVNDAQNEPSQGNRRPSFTLALECNYHGSQPSLDHSQQLQSKQDHCPFTEELRRPSFKAAIERGKDHYTAPSSTPKRKFVQIASPEITESREITALASPNSWGMDEANFSSVELPKSVKFYLYETDQDHGAQTGTMKLGSSSQQNSDSAVSSMITPSSSLSSSQSSALMSASWFSSMSSSSAFDDLSHSFSLAARYCQEKEDMASCALAELEHGHELTDVNGSTADVSQHPRNMTASDVTRGHHIRDVGALASPQNHSKVRACKPSMSARSSNPLQYSFIATSTAAPLHSCPSSVPSSLINPATAVKSGTDSHGIRETSRDTKPVGVNRNTGAGEIPAVSSGCDLQKSRRKAVVDSPPDARCCLSVEHPKLSVVPSTVSDIRQIHLASKKTEQMRAQTMKLPEVTEIPTLDARNAAMIPSMPDRNTPQISVTDEDADLPLVQSGDIVTPSLSDSFLGKLGLSPTNCSSDTDSSIDQLSEKEVESKFVTLSLAFKSDRYTLDRRVSAQERARDLAEQNVDIELHDLKHAVEALTEIVSDALVRGLLQKIKMHLDVLQQATARVSSRAEVFGAVQQEKRLSKAMEIMVQYTENLRRIREKEEMELSEARKLLSEKSGNNLSTDSDTGPNKRSLSVSGYSATSRMTSAVSQTTNVITNTMNAAGDSIHSTSMRRKSEVALPRIIGGTGSPSLIPNTLLEVGAPMLGYTHSSQLPQEAEDREDPKSRFQSAVASTSMQNVVTTTMKHCSLDKQMSVPPSSSLLPHLYLSSASSSSLNNESNFTGGDRMSKDEDAFRKGFEEGLKTKLSHELNEIRDQQNSISNSLDQMMDKVEQSQLEEDLYFNRPSRLESTLSLVSSFGGHILRYDWRSSKNIVRNLAGVLFVFLACLIVFLSPPLSTIDVKHFTKPPQ